MSEPKIETGKFDWGQGRGYVRPADSPNGAAGLPPGWNEPPVYRDPEPATPQNVPGDRQTAREFMGTPAETGPPMSAEWTLGYIAGMNALADHVQPNVVPTERINLDNWSAVFRGHNIELSPQERDAIKLVLAGAVIRQIEEEKERMLSELQLETVRPAGAAEQQNVPEVPGSEGSVEQGPPGSDGGVQ